MNTQPSSDLRNAIWRHFYQEADPGGTWVVSLICIIFLVAISVSILTEQPSATIAIFLVVGCALGGYVAHETRGAKKKIASSNTILLLNALRNPLSRVRAVECEYEENARFAISFPKPPAVVLGQEVQDDVTLSLDSKLLKILNDHGVTIPPNQAHKTEESQATSLVGKDGQTIHSDGQGGTADSEGVQNGTMTWDEYCLAFFISYVTVGVLVAISVFVAETTRPAGEVFGKDALVHGWRAFIAAAEGVGWPLFTAAETFRLPGLLWEIPLAAISFPTFMFLFFQTIRRLRR